MTGTILLAAFLCLCTTPTLGSWETTDLFVTANTYELIGFVGKAVTMYATVRGDPRPTADDITWLKMSSNLPVDRVVILYDTSTNESRLRISNLEFGDAGTYYCMAKVNDVVKSVSMELRIVVEPRVERVSGLINSKAVGQSVTFSVTVDGNPMPQPENISWAKMDEWDLPTGITHNRQTLSDGNKELVIDTLEIEDEGWYKCLVKTDEGRADVAFLLHVLGVRSIQETAVGVVGNSVTMSCVATYFDMLADSPAITWYRTDDPSTPLSGSSIVSKDVTNHAVSELVLDNLDWSDDGDYFCTSSYPAYPDHSIYNATLSIRGVSESPVQGTAVFGRSAVFQCQATGNIPAVWTWKRNGVTITGDSVDSFDPPLSSTTFTYTGVVAEDVTAEFTCEAEFEGDSHESAPASITVLGVTSSPSSVYGVVGGSATLSCEVSGIPASFVWEHDGGEVRGDTQTITSPTPSSSQIVVESLSRADHGDYSCVPIYSPEGELFLGGNTTSSPGTVSVIGLTVPPVQTIVKVGDTATFTCKANAVPVPTLSWFKDGAPLSSGVSSPVTESGERVSYLTITNVGEEDVASYTCKATYPSLGEHVSEDADLKFRGIEVQPIVTDAIIGYASQMNCTARGEAEADMQWFANGTEIQSTDVYTILTASNYDASKDQDLIDTRTILQVSEIDMDISYLEIICRATWVSGGKSVTVDSKTVKFNPLHVYESPVATIAVRYTKVEMECSATGNPLIRWDRSGRTYGVGIIDMESDQTHSTLIIGNVTEADQGKIWCVAQYDEGVYNSETATLTVVGITSEPQSVTLPQRGLSVQFTCIVDRYPLNTVSWYKGDTLIQEYENRKNMTVVTKDLTVEYLLGVSSITEEDMGDYYCKAEYPQGTQTSQPAYLNIEEPAQITLIVATGGDKEGESIELLCQATGVPKPTITWRRSGQPFPGDSTSSVVTIYNEPGSSLVLINSTASSDEGVYSCVASNGIGDPAIMDTELVIEAAVKVVTVASASSLLVFIIAVCVAVMLFALYRRRKRKRLHPHKDEKVQPSPEEDVENHVYDNEAKADQQPQIQFSLTKATAKTVQR